MGAIKIHRGNDAPLQLMVVRGDGVLEDYAGVSELSVQFVKNGARWVTVEPTAPIVAVNSGVNVIVPADTPVGNYRAIVKYRRGDRRYLAENCHAIDVIECVEEATTDDTVSVDVTLRVQFSADGKDGLSAYELAVLNGYPGTYEEWVKMYARLQPTRISFIGVSGNVLHTIEVATPVEYSSYGSSYAYEPVGDWGEPVGEWIEDNIEEE